MNDEIELEKLEEYTISDLNENETDNDNFIPEKLCENFNWRKKEENWRDSLKCWREWIKFLALRLYNKEKLIEI